MHAQFLNLNRSRRPRVAVIGDCLIDQYHYGSVDRISPEFPVPVLLSLDDESSLLPGGAANVCHQFEHLNVEPFLVGPVDEAADRVYARYPFNRDYCVSLGSGRVPRKVRFYEGGFPLLRWDIERPGYGEPAEGLEYVRDLLFENFKSLLESGLDIAVLSDYGKGVWSPALARRVIRACNERGVPTVVDPKRPPLDHWQFCTVFKPNASEARSLTGHTDWRRQVGHLKQYAKSVVITRSAAGVVGGTADGEFSYEPPPVAEQDVRSVIGAGDCFAAVLATGLAHGMGVADASRVAFEAGVQYVQARHNRPVSPYDIHRRFDPAGAKVVSLGDLCHLRERVFPDETFALTNGCFDLLHAGHLSTLRFARSQGQRLVVAVNADASVARLKGPTRPLQPLADRCLALAALECVDFVVGFPEDTPLEVIRRLRPDVLVKGQDYGLEQVVGREFAGRTVLAPVVAGLSTTGMVKRIRQEG